MTDTVASSQPDSSVPANPTAPGPRTPAEVFDPRRLFSFEAARSLPLIAGLMILAIWFNVASHGTFLNGQEISYTLVDACQIGVVALGVVFVLLLAEIDLSLSSLVALSGCTSALIMQEWVPHASDFERMLVGMAAAIMVGALCGLWNGFWIAVIRVPSFVVTLAAFLAFNGIALYITNSQTIFVSSAYFNAFGSSSTVLNDGYLANLWGNHTNIVHLSIGMLLAVALGLGYLGVLLLKRRDRTRNGLPVSPVIFPILQWLGLTIIALAIVEKLDYFFGVPLPVVVFLGLLLVYAYVLSRTRFGRHIYAVGGNAEAARRAGIPVQRLRLAVFVISGCMAGVGAIIATARYNNMSAGAIAPDFLLDCIAAAIIGGVSLFGGRGSVWSVVLGSLILASVSNGMLLTLAGGSSSGFYETYIVKGAILLGAVALDSIVTGGRGTGVGLWATNMAGRLPGLRRT